MKTARDHRPRAGFPDEWGFSRFFLRLIELSVSEWAHRLVVCRCAPKLPKGELPEDGACLFLELLLHGRGRCWRLCSE